MLALVLITLGCDAASAAADQAVVNATVYPGPRGSISTRTASLSMLSGCTPYSGANPMYLYPGGQPLQLPLSSTWALSTVLTCGLQVPLTDVTNVQVVRSPSSRGLEEPLTDAELSDSSQWQEAGALPVISTDGSENQNTYTRPWKGGSDRNASDQVTVQGEPIAIAVYESGPPLTVNASRSTLSESATAMRVKFAATVRDANGASVPAASLTWSWNFGDGGASNAAAPTHAFAPGTYPVTVQVTDPGVGNGGTATIQVTARTSKSGSGPHNHGGGNNHTKSRAPIGPNRSHGTHPGAGAGSGKGSGTNAGATNGSQTNAAGATGPSTAGGQNGNQGHAHDGGSQSTGSGTTTGTTPPTRPGQQTSRRSPHVTVAPSAPLVRGRLISDVTAVSPATSPLVHTAPAARAAAPQVRQATRVSLLPVVLGVLVVIGLAALGAARELRGRGGWRALRTGN